MYSSSWIVGWYCWIGKKPLSLLIPVIFTQAASLQGGFMKTPKEYIVVRSLNKQQQHKEHSCCAIHLRNVKLYSKKKKSISFQSRRQLINALITYFPNQFLVRWCAVGSQITTKCPARIKAVVVLLGCFAHLRAVMTADCRAKMKSTCHIYAVMFYQYRRSVDCCFSVSRFLSNPTPRMQQQPALIKATLARTNYSFPDNAQH